MIVSKGKWLRLKKLDPPVDLGGIVLPEQFKGLQRAEWMVAGVSDTIEDPKLFAQMVLVKNQTVQEIPTKEGPQYFVHWKNVHAIVLKNRKSSSTDDVIKILNVLDKDTKKTSLTEDIGLIEKVLGEDENK